MLRGFLKSLFLTYAITLTFLASLQGQEKQAAPIPIQITAAKKVFVSNAGLDSKSLLAFRNSGDANRPYEEFYTAIKKWGRFELVSSPTDADLVFELRFEAPLSGCNSMDQWDPQLRLRILDTKTHFTLWALTEPVEGAYRKATWVKNFDDGLGHLVENLKKLMNDSR